MNGNSDFWIVAFRFRLILLKRDVMIKLIALSSV